LFLSQYTAGQPEIQTQEARTPNRKQIAEAFQEWLDVTGNLERDLPLLLLLYYSHA